MTDPGDALRAYVKGRLSMGEPEIFVSSGQREVLLDLARRAVSPTTTERRPLSDAGRLSAAGTREELLAIPDMASLREVAEGCVRCGLHATRTRVVFADGPDSARVLCVGEAPGANEDASGVPFVGRAGQLLDRLLRSAGLPRDEVFICNVLKCRPPGNRNPNPDEIEACSPFLVRQVELVAPRVIAAFGTFAAQTLLDTRESLGRLRGRTHLYRGYPLVVTYHPAALLRNPGWVRPAWEDLQRIRTILEGDAETIADSVDRTPPREPTASPHFGPEDQLTLGDTDG